MLKNAFRMAKTSLKLLLRNKGFMVVGILVPLCATLLLNIWYESDQLASASDDYTEIESIDTLLAYMVNFNCYAVKIYDRSYDENADGFCNELLDAGLFQVFRADAREYSIEEIEESVRRTAKKDKVSGVIILDKDSSKTKLYRVGEDERFDLLKNVVEMNIANPVKSQSPKQITNYVAVASNGEVNYMKTREFSYCLSIATIAFIFGGVLILGVILTEQKDHVLSRIMLTKATRSSYILSKVMLVLGLSIIQTISMVIGFITLVKVDISLNVWQFALIIFLQGIVFNFFSVCAGIFCKSMSAAAFLAFTTCTMSDLLAGLYFDISGASELYKKVAMVFPQRWALISVTKLQNGDSYAYPLILSVTAAYLVVILVVGVIGLKFIEEE